MKDNRILPQGFLPLDDRRLEIAMALGADDELADDVGATGVGDDPDYVSRRRRLAGLRGPARRPAGEASARPASRRPSTTRRRRPSILQDRFCTAKGPDVERLHFLVGHLNLDGTASRRMETEGRR